MYVWSYTTELELQGFSVHDMQNLEPLQAYELHDYRRALRKGEYPIPSSPKTTITITSILHGVMEIE